MKLPTVVTNNPTVRINTNGEIWVRTPIPSTHFMLIRKDNGTYMPAARMGSIESNIMVSVNRDWTLTASNVTETSSTYVLNSIDPDKVWRVVKVPASISEFVKPVKTKE